MRIDTGYTAQRLGARWGMVRDFSVSSFPPDCLLDCPVCKRKGFGQCCERTGVAVRAEGASPEDSME
jgi:hypothetical protein